MKLRILFIAVAFITALITYYVSAPKDLMFFISDWSPAWVQALGSICAVLVAIYVPWKIEMDKRQAESIRRAELQRLSLKVIGHEAWLMKQFFIHCYHAVDRDDEAALEDFSGETAPIDSKSPFVMEHGKFSIVTNLPDEIATAYMNAVSRRFLAINYMKAYLWDLRKNGVQSNEMNKGLAIRACREGEDLCEEIITLTQKECIGLRFGLKPGGYDEKN